MYFSGSHDVLLRHRTWTQAALRYSRRTLPCLPFLVPFHKTTPRTRRSTGASGTRSWPRAACTARTAPGGARRAAATSAAGSTTCMSSAVSGDHVGGGRPVSAEGPAEKPFADWVFMFCRPRPASGRPAPHSIHPHTCGSFTRKHRTPAYWFAGSQSCASARSTNAPPPILYTPSPSACRITL